MLYLIIILTCMAIIRLLDYFTAVEYLGLSILEIALGVTISVVAIIIIDLIFAFIVRRCLPKKWFGKDISVIGK